MAAAAAAGAGAGAGATTSKQPDAASQCPETSQNLNEIDYFGTVPGGDDVLVFKLYQLSKLRMYCTNIEYRIVLI